MNGAHAEATMAHANALLIGERGVLLRGVSGSGKSALSCRLLEGMRLRGDFARLIGDDRVALTNCNGRLIARPHPAIAGAIELRGLGLAPAPFEPAGVIRVVVDLAAPGGERPPRYPLPNADLTQICGLSLPRCMVEAGDYAVVEKILYFIQSVGVNSFF